MYVSLHRISQRSIKNMRFPRVPDFLEEHSYLGGGHRGLLETEKPRKKSLKTAKPQEISSKTENRIKLLTHKALVVFRISLSVLNLIRINLF